MPVSQQLCGPTVCVASLENSCRCSQFAFGVDPGLWTHTLSMNGGDVALGSSHLPKRPPSSGLHGGVEVSRMDLQLEGWRDVEEAADSWLEAQGVWWAWAV